MCPITTEQAEQSTPVRPPRSPRRLTADSLPSLDTFETPPPLPTLSRADTPDENGPVTPSTPKTPTVARPKLANRKSTASIRRKPVPRTSEELSRELAELQGAVGENDIVRPNTPRTPSLPSSSSEPPRYILPVDPPLPSSSSSASPAVGHHASEIRDGAVAVPEPQQRGMFDFSASRPPSYAGETLSSPTPAYAAGPSSSRAAQDPFLDLTGGLGVAPPSTEDLPTYAEETQTEPHTLARALFRWGFLCPLLWFIGMCILWIPLRPVEEESDPEKAQKLDEMIVILRETELKYARRCAYAFLGFTVLLVAIIVIAVVVSMVR